MTKLAWIVCLATSLHLAAAQIQVEKDASALGLPTGATAPDFSLPDQFGHKRTLASLAGPKGLVLVFLRSADW